MWIDVDDRLPEIGRTVKVWGNHCATGSVAPIAYRRLEPNSRSEWFWSSTEWRGMSGIYWWWDGPADAPMIGWHPLVGPGDSGYGG